MAIAPITAELIVVFFFNAILNRCFRFAINAQNHIYALRITGKIRPNELSISALWVDD